MMILAEKITQLRKKEGWSQEQMAEKLGGSRQSVSKWESAQSMPDMNRILLLAKVFGVSTDFLLNDEMETDAPQTVLSESSSDEAFGARGETLVPVDMETADGFLKYREVLSRRVSLGVMLCILGAAAILFGSALDIWMHPETDGEGFATIAGVIILLALVAVAVGIFVTSGLRGEKYAFLEKESLDTAYGIEGMCRERKSRYEDTHTRLLVVGIMLCVVSAIPLLAVSLVSEEMEWLLVGSVGILLVLVAIGVYLIVRTSIIWEGYQILLEEGDYVRENKKVQRKISGIYWGSATAVYLLISFLTMRWELTWIVWPVAAVAYGVLSELLRSSYR